MSRIKGRYVAQLIIDIDVPLVLPDANKAIQNMHRQMTPVLKRILKQEFDDAKMIDVIEQYFDLYEGVDT